MLISPSSKIRLWHTGYGILEQHLRQPTHEKFICDVFLLVGVFARHLDGSNIYFVGHCRFRWQQSDNPRIRIDIRLLRLRSVPNEWMGDSWLCPCNMGHLKSYNWTMVHSAVEEKVAARLLIKPATKTHRAQSGGLSTEVFLAENTCSVSFDRTNHAKFILG